MNRPDHTTLFDHEIDDASDLTEEFWGSGATWQPRRSSASRPRPAHRPTEGTDTTGTMRAIRDGVAAFRPQRVELRDATGQVRRTRSHGAGRRDDHRLEGPTRSVDSIAELRAEASIGDLAAGHYDEPFDSHADELTDVHPFVDDSRDLGRRHDRSPDRVVPLSARAGIRGPGVDPLLARLGGMLAVGVLLVPVALALRPSEPAPDSVRIEAPAGASDAPGGAPAGPQAAPQDTAVVAESAPTAADDTATDRASDTGAAPAPSSETSTSGEPAAEGAAVAGGQPAAASTAQAVTDAVEETTRDAGISDGATVDAEAERVVPACPQTYTAAPGDSWYRIADAAGVSPDALMTENRATIDTVILPGDQICLPAGATMPAPPTTTPATTTPATTTPATTSPATTQPPATTPPGSPGRDASVAEVKDLIRSIFPESEWETAFTIADRESRFDPEAYNGWCCYGVFQIYWDVHRGWLDDLGINSSDDLFDPLLNVQAAYAIWQRAGNSWRPWSTYDG